jgi:hypothetical protein
VPAQPCFKLASALLVTYGEEGILAVQECGRRRRQSLRKARPLGAALEGHNTWRSRPSW